MHEISEKQLDFIIRFIRKKGVRNRHLENDLVDHICCMIEEEMEKEMPFFDAFMKTVRSFGPHGLLKLQIQTNLFINKSYMITRIFNLGINFVSLFLCLFFITFPVYLSVDMDSVAPALLCVPVILTGLWAILFGFSYRDFEYKVYTKISFSHRSRSVSEPVCRIAVRKDTIQYPQTLHSRTTFFTP